MPVDAKLKAVIAQVESSNNPHALRFEPLIYARVRAGAYAKAVDACEATNRCTRETAFALVSFSYGLYQIMGFNIYSGAHKGVTIDAIMTDHVLQDGLFDDFFYDANLADVTLAQIKSDPEAREHFIRGYNGPGAIDAYWALMQRAISTLNC